MTLVIKNLEHRKVSIQVLKAIKDFNYVIIRVMRPMERFIRSSLINSYLDSIEMFLN